ncbi:MAG: acyltransferase [Leptospiraceae bacterium]|nr:acyltransferase [Leptospiraceae bacterium]
MSRIATDLLRIFAVTCIVFNHVSWPLFVSSAGPEGGILGHISAIVNQLGKPSVLFFLFLSGLAFAGKKEVMSPRDFYRNRLLRILPPFLLVSFIYALESGEAISILDPLLWLFGGTAHYHLYFVAILLYLYLLYPLLREIPYKPSYLVGLFALGLFLHLINSLRYQSPLPVFMGFTLAPAGSLATIHPGSAGEHWTIIWTEYFAWAVPFFMMGLWMPEIVKRHPWLKPANQRAVTISEPAAMAEMEAVHQGQENSPIKRWSGFAFRITLVFLGFLLVFNDFVAGYETGMHPDPAGRVWRISVGLYALALIFAMLSIPSKQPPVWVKKLSRASFLVYLIHPLWIEATKFLHPWHQTQIVIPLSWITALGLYELAVAIPGMGLFLGEGDRSLGQLFRRDRDLPQTDK